MSEIVDATGGFTRFYPTHLFTELWIKIKPHFNNTEQRNLDHCEGLTHPLLPTIWVQVVGAAI